LPTTTGGAQRLELEGVFTTSSGYSGQTGLSSSRTTPPSFNQEIWGWGGTLVMFIARYLVGVRKKRKLGRDGKRPSEEAMLLMLMMMMMMKWLMMGVTLSDRRGARSKAKEKKREKEEDQENTKQLRTQPKPISTSAQLPLLLYLLYLLNPLRPPLEPPHPRPLLQQHHRDPPHKERARRT
jgi:hypothetical protein